MGENEQLSGLLLNGLLPDEYASVIQVLDGERWVEAEKRTAELIACIQPNQPSENRRGAVADYVQRLIMKCFPCQVVTFGSVPLKTYLPDGDIDVTAFSKNQNLKDTWAVQVRDILESEEKNEKAEFRVKEVQYIQAEVKIIKCLVENIVVDISFNQLGGLCTLCFLEEVDNLIDQDHLFKRSIILIKAWCYYESRILGAHHGLISTYALETLVLYIFHIYNNSFTGPLEVLYRFLEFFRNFDWENFCVSLWGPVPVSSLPDINAEPPRKDGGELLLSKVFLQACNSVYAVFPAGLENQGQPFISKHFNVIDPLRINNNLGRSVSKGNFYRIRSAFAFGAKRIARLLDCPKENIAFELNQFFMNTWDRHGNGIRPDASMSDPVYLRPSNPDHGSDNHFNPSNNKESSAESSVQCIQSLPSLRTIQPLESTSNCIDSVTSFSVLSQKTDGNSSSSRMPNEPENVNSKLSVESKRSQKTLKHDQIANQLQGKHLFARTRSSPELTGAYLDTSSRSRPIKHTESGKDQVASCNVDCRIASISNIDDARTIVINDDDASLVIGAQGMQQEEQDLVNMMASSSLHKFAGQITMPLNLGSTHLPLSMCQSVLGSIGYGMRSAAGIFPANTPVIDPNWSRNFQFYQGLMSSPLSQYFSGDGLSTNLEYLIQHGGESLMEIKQGIDPEYWHKQDVPSTSMRNGYVKSVQNENNRLIETHSDERISASRNSSASQTCSGRSKTSSESSWDGSSAKVSRVSKEKRGRKGVRHSKNQVKGKNIHDYVSSEADDESGDCITLASRENNIDECITTSLTAPMLNVSHHETGGSDSVISIAPMVAGTGSGQRGTDNSGQGRFTFYPTGPPVPFFVYNYSGQIDNSEPSSTPLGGEDNPDNSESVQAFASTDVLNSSNHIRKTTTEEFFEEPKQDILNSDFASHWQNLQFGRLCQAPRYPAPVVGPSVAGPPVYLQGHVPWDGPGRPVSGNGNMLPQLVSYGQHLVPVIPLQSDSSRPSTVYQRFADELPRYRSGTGTYLPNPKVSASKRGARRNNYNYDRSDHADREGNWNAAKSRASGRSHNRTQADKSRVDRFAVNENRVDRPWAAHRHQPPSYQAQNGPSRPSSSHSNVVYPLPGMNPCGVTPNGSALQSIVMLYPYDHNSGYAPPGSQPEFTSLGPVGYVGPTDASQPAEDQRHHRSSTKPSSPDPPSSPHFHRRS